MLQNNMCSSTYITSSKKYYWPIAINEPLIRNDLIYHFISFTQLPVKKLYETKKRLSISSYWKIIQKNAKHQYLIWRLPNTNNFIIRNANIANEKYISFRELGRRKSIIRRTWILHIWRSKLSNRQKVPVYWGNTQTSHRGSCSWHLIKHIKNQLLSFFDWD